ncbi:MAG: hypothetical protein RBR69_03285 [Candidatus Cloacimonadaceae bacterium]|nr:hypothetical protein [Candidatus Cloacimonadota bacterium]MCK9177655.1 hypothetical protein [Candidatus Cloacimonadota bacterium]MCK9242622.1 hypothetical protein [Candidatus Cloacimonadota bacterium]MDD3533102.1 hypothetical protein [Candidatus Cloacimonadota bacterium]MDY0127140.1 hypothetical protein [Candidatus Cloacimonadaceae bacterium]
MSKKYLWYILMLALITIAGCAEKNTAYQDADALSLLAVVPVVGNPTQLAYDDVNMYVSLDQGGLGAIDLENFTLDWYTEMKFSFADTYNVFKQTRRLAVVPEHNRLFLNEITDTDEIWIIDTTHPDSLTIIENAIGNTQGIRDFVARSIPSPISANVMEAAYCFSNSIIYRLYDGELWIGFGVNLTNLPVQISGVDFDENYIYGAAQQRGLWIFSKEDGSYVSDLGLYGEARKLVVRDGYAYVACRQGGLQIVDVRDPQNPVRISGYDTSGYANEVDYHDGTVAISSGGGGAYVFDVSNPAEPVLMQRMTEVGYSNAVKFKGDVLAIGSRDDGVFFYKMNK